MCSKHATFKENRWSGFERYPKVLKNLIGKGTVLVNQFGQNTKENYTTVACYLFVFYFLNLWM